VPDRIELIVDTQPFRGAQQVYVYSFYSWFGYRFKPSDQARKLFYSAHKMLEPFGIKDDGKIGQPKRLYFKLK
jgi:hypothetical protein